MRWAAALMLAWILPAQASEVIEVESAASILSRYAPGQTPADPPVVLALRTLARGGGPTEVSLLQNLAAHEDGEVAKLAGHALATIRARQRKAQRQAFADSLPTKGGLAQRTRAWQEAGLGKQEASCTAYAAHVLGDGSSEALDRPLARQALARAEEQEAPPEVKARLLEDLGAVHEALRRYAGLAASGHDGALDVLEAFGVNPERLLLGLLALENAPALDEETLLEVLVSQGDALTVKVLVERSERIDPDRRSATARALADLLESRDLSLDRKVIRDAQRALESTAGQTGDREAVKSAR